MKIKKGTLLIAIDNCIMEDTRMAALDIGKEYPVKKVEGQQFYVESELFSYHMFTEGNYKLFFKIKGEQEKTELKKIRAGVVSGWLLFRELMPELNQKIEIYWSTDEITKQIWRNDIPWTGNEIPRFWRACH